MVVKIGFYLKKNEYPRQLSKLMETIIGEIWLP